MSMEVITVDDMTAVEMKADEMSVNKKTKA